jgi:hypothetical protein
MGVYEGGRRDQPRRVDDRVFGFYFEIQIPADPEKAAGRETDINVFTFVYDGHFRPFSKALPQGRSQLTDVPDYRFHLARLFSLFIDV